MSEHSESSSVSAPRCIFTEKAPKPVGHYCQARVTGGLVFVSGQGGLVPPENRMVPGGAGAQAEQALKNISAILLAAGSSMRHVTRVTIYYTDLDRDKDEVNKAYAKAFDFRDGYKPARMVFQVAKQPIPDALVSIDAIAGVADD